MNQTGEKVPSDGYYAIDVIWEGGFKHTVPCRGYNLGSQLRFQESIDYIKKFTYKTITKAKYEKMVYGSSLT